MGPSQQADPVAASAWTGNLRVFRNNAAAGHACEAAGTRSRQHPPTCLRLRRREHARETMRLPEIARKLGAAAD
jgi:hypothetical protein